MYANFRITAAVLISTAGTFASVPTTGPVPTAMSVLTRVAHANARMMASVSSTQTAIKCVNARADLSGPIAGLMLTIVRRMSARTARHVLIKPMGIHVNVRQVLNPHFIELTQNN